MSLRFVSPGAISCACEAILEPATIAGWLLVNIVALLLIHGASKARTDRMLGEEIDSVTGGKG